MHTYHVEDGKLTVSIDLGSCKGSPELCARAVLYVINCLSIYSALPRNVSSIGSAVAKLLHDKVVLREAD